MSQLKDDYDRILKEDLSCWKCSEHQKNIPALKSHLQDEFDKAQKRAKSAPKTSKRKRAGDLEEVESDRDEKVIDSKRRAKE